MKSMGSINMALTIHRVNNPDQNMLVDQQWEVSNPILSITNLQDLPIHFFSNPEELMVWVHIWESGFPLCIIPQVFHFLELVVWCAKHFAPDSNSIVSEQLYQILITISKDNIIKMFGLHIKGFLDQNVVTLSEEILVHKFTSATPQVQLSCVQSIQRPKYVTLTL